MNEKIIARFNEEKAQREYEINCTNQLVKKVEDFCANLAEKMLTARNLEPSSSMKAEFAEFKTQLKNQMENHNFSFLKTIHEFYVKCIK